MGADRLSARKIEFSPFAWTPNAVAMKPVALLDDTLK